MKVVVLTGGSGARISAESGAVPFRATDAPVAAAGIAALG
jgi:hypothetical protein